MNAIRVHEFGDPSVLRLEEIPTPLPGPRQVLIRVHAAGVNPVDTYIRAGKYGPKPFPFTPGADAAGTIESLGPDVPNLPHLQFGARVYTSGTITGAYAQFTLASFDRLNPLPPSVSFQQGAAVGIPAGAAFRALFQRGAALPAESVLIHGATGGVGTAAVQLARAAGLLVFATAGSESGKQYLLSQGAHHALPHDITDRPEEVQSLTAGKGFDLILEMLANKNLAADLPCLAPRGRVVVVGSRGPIEIDPRQTMVREADIRGITLAGATDAEHRAIYAALTAALESKTLVPFIGLELPLAQAQRSHTEIMEGDSHGKIVLIP
jgi:NADPH2:quinone reductase